MVPDASVTACEVPDTSLLVIQVITKRSAVNLADILITKYISPDRVLIRIQFAHGHAVPVHEVRCLPVLRDCIPEPFRIIMVLLHITCTAYGGVPVIRIICVTGTLCSTSALCGMYLCRKAACGIIFITDGAGRAVKFCELVAAVVAVMLRPACPGPGEPVACMVITVSGRFPAQCLPGQPAHAAV